MGLLLAAACGESSVGSSAPPLCGGGSAFDSGIPDYPVVPEMDEQTFASEYVKAYCDAIRRCCEAAQVAFGQSDCEAAAQAELDALKSGGSRHFDPSAGAQCIAGLKWFGEVCPMTGTITLLGPGIICGGVYVGTLPAAAPCSSRNECQPPPGGSAMCLRVSPNAPNVCVTFTNDRGPGETCTRFSEATAVHHDCIEGYECDETTGVCEAECTGGLGANCQSQTCAAGLRCDPGTYRCVAISPTGGACSDDLDCWDTCSDGVCTIELNASSCYSAR